MYTQSEVLDFIEDMGEKRPTLPYDIDGVVIKLDNLKDHEKMGNTIRYEYGFFRQLIQILYSYFHHRYIYHLNLS